MKISIGAALITRRDIILKGLIHYMAPMTGGFECEIPEGTEFVVLTNPNVDRGGFYVRPSEYHKFEIQHVPKSERDSKKYDGFSFVFNTADLGIDYELQIES